MPEPLPEVVDVQPARRGRLGDDDRLRQIVIVRVADSGHDVANAVGELPFQIPP